MLSGDDGDVYVRISNSYAKDNEFSVNHKIFSIINCLTSLFLHCLL